MNILPYLHNPKEPVEGEEDCPVRLHVELNKLDEEYILNKHLYTDNFDEISKQYVDRVCPICGTNYFSNCFYESQKIVPNKLF